MEAGDAPPLVSIVGRKNSGKTTLLVRMASELRRRGLRVASVKHGHHAFDIDHPGRDSWRHVHEGGVEAVLMMSSEKIAMVMQTRTPVDVREAVARHFEGRGYDLVLVEGFKYGDLPKIEIHRAGTAEGPVYDTGDAAAARHFLALVTDIPDIPPGVPIIPLAVDAADAPHVLAAADIVQRHLDGSGGDG